MMNRRGFLKVFSSLLVGAALVPSFLEELYSSAGQGRQPQFWLDGSGSYNFFVGDPSNISEGDFVYWDGNSLHVVGTLKPVPLGVVESVEESGGRVSVRLQSAGGGHFLLDRDWREVS